MTDFTQPRVFKPCTCGVGNEKSYYYHRSDCDFHKDVASMTKQPQSPANTGASVAEPSPPGLVGPTSDLVTEAIRHSKIELSKLEIPADPGTGFKKADQEKIRWELLPFAQLEKVARVFTYGAKKYADENYLKGTTWRRYLGAACRHLTSWAMGEENDPESGEPHLAHAICSILMLMELQRVGTGTDDRVKR